MLQQTQVKTVLPYYQRFLASFPSIHHLDRARRDKVMALWSGLGYYRRATNLKQAAREIVRRHGGKLPRNYAALRALPGAGGIFADAVMSIAFGERYPALDANARRVLSRIYETPDEAALKAVAARVVPGARPGDFNQALMDLGATVCLARNPRCAECPTAPLCAASRGGRIAKSAAKVRTRKVEWPLAVIARDGKILLRRRAERGLLAGMWEIPGGEKKPRERITDALARELTSARTRVASASMLGVVRHSITDRNIRAPVYLCTLERDFREKIPGWRWLPLAALKKLPISALSMKAARLVQTP